MEHLVYYGILSSLAAPLVTAILIALFGRRTESIASRFASLGALTLLVTTSTLLISRFITGQFSYEINLGELYQHGDYRFALVLFLDKPAAVFMGLTAFLAAVIVKYCRYYLHRESGYARFFFTIFVFLFGMNLLVLSGTIDMLFAGWEIVGISSFLLIGFYRDRTQPVRNALRAYSVYRVCDVGLLLGAWLGHLIWHGSQRFSNWPELAASGFGGASQTALFGLSLLILLAASGKSAQFPFCYWLPRAMEGPTPSSAIFYGALSIHAGVFLLLRTYPLWHSVTFACWATGIVGVLSAIVGTLCGRVQSNIKGQIAYSSITQVGLMLLELALGFPNLALVHLVGNAFMRCYQLLVSPSVVAHLLRVQAAAGEELRISDWSMERLMPGSARSTLYAAALSEAYLESIVRLGIWDKLGSLGRRLQRWELSGNRLVGASIATLAIALLALDGYFPREWTALILIGFSGLATVSAMAERKSALRAWNAAAFSVTLAGASVWAIDPVAHGDVLVYFFGVIPGWVLGTLALRSLGGALGQVTVSEFHGLVEKRPAASLLLFLAFLTLAGFPISPAFLGEDLLLHYALGEHLWLAATISLAFVVNGLTLAWIFARVCLGPPKPETSAQTRAAA